MTINDIEPRTHVGRWRVRSPLAAVIDRMMAVVGFAMIMVAATNSLVSWRSNTILLMPGQVERVMGIVLFPAMTWLLVSELMVFGVPQRGERTFFMPRPRKLRWRGQRGKLLAVIALFCLGVIVGGFFVGGAKGSLRVLPGPQYQVSTYGLGTAEWTTVSAAQYQVWEAKFIRGDGLFTFFGLWILGGAMAFAQVRRDVAVRSRGSDAVPPTAT